MSTVPTCRAIILLTLILSLAGCTSWAPISPSFGLPPRVRVTTESDRFVLQDAQVVGDTYVTGVRTGGDPQLVRLSEILLLEAGYTDAGRTALLIVAIPVGVGVAAFACAAGLICPGLH